MDKNKDKSIDKMMEEEPNIFNDGLTEVDDMNEHKVFHDGLTIKDDDEEDVIFEENENEIIKRKNKTNAKILLEGKKIEKQYDYSNEYVNKDTKRK